MADSYLKLTEGLTSSSKMDFHIHPRPFCFDPDNLAEYVEIAMEYGLMSIGFLEHGIRRSPKHKGILIDEQSIRNFIESVERVKCRYTGTIKIFCGVELDYFDSDDEAMDYLRVVERSKLDFVIGSVHGHYDLYEDYLQATIDMLERYPIAILGHFKISENIAEYSDYVARIMKLLSDKNILFEYNLAPRNQSVLDAMSFIRKELERLEIESIVGSDSHSIGDIRSIYAKYYEGRVNF